MKKYFLVIVLIALISGSCSSLDGDNGKQDLTHFRLNFKNLQFLDSVNSINLLLDTLTSSNITCTQLYEPKDGSDTLISFLNSLDNSIYFYDLVTKLFRKKIKLEKEGPNGTGTGGIEGFYIKNMDSIFVTSRYSVTIINSVGMVKRRYNFATILKENKITVLPNIGTGQEMIIKGATAFIHCAPDISPFSTKNYDNNCCVIKLDLITGNYTYLFKYPELYRRNIYGPNYSIFYSGFNSNNGVLLSFPNDPFIYISEDIESGKIQPQYAGSDMFDYVNPMESKRQDFEYYTRFFIQNPSYGPIIYDKYRNIYYRFALIPLSDQDYQERRWWKRKRIIVLDSNFTKIGESEISQSCSYLNYFISPRGLYIARSSNVESQLLYTLFQIKKNAK